MKPRISLYAVIVFTVIVLGTVWFFSMLEDQEPLSVFPATINRDCAPWDGSAFTVSIPVSDGAIIATSIYQSPDIRLPVTFSFPDETMRAGNALLLLPVGVPEPLTGKVSFPRVEQGLPVEGKFDLLTETGRQFKGSFKAEWENQPVYCG
ncbi:MAG: hypothetical protein EHM33_27550 [Chloroflexi bacterium]|nr:MAG: hypothetical protein EHM33_27550 [Chloroflexota bacterium]